MIRVAVNGYGTIGKRVADAVAAQPDMEIIGVSKTRPSAEAYAAARRGFPLYIADMEKERAFTEVGLEVAGSVGEMVGEADVVVDATPGGVGAKNRPMYRKAGVKAIFQGGEDHEVAGFSFNAHCNFDAARGRDLVRVVSCNTTGLCRIIRAMDGEYGVRRVKAVMVRRGTDPGEIKKGPIDAVVLDPVTIPSHHGPDVKTVLPEIEITTVAMKVSTTFMHMHFVQMELARSATREGVISVIEDHSRMGLVRPGTGIRSTAELKEYAHDIGRPRGDLWENCIFEDSISVTGGTELMLFQAIHQEADVVVENVDAIRAMMDLPVDAEESIRMTNEAVGLVPI